MSTAAAVSELVAGDEVAIVNVANSLDGVFVSIASFLMAEHLQIVKSVDRQQLLSVFNVTFRLYNPYELHHNIEVD